MEYEEHNSFLIDSSELQNSRKDTIKVCLQYSVMINVIYLYEWGSDIAFYKQKCIAEAHFMQEYLC